jgi:hypothetical protein
MRKFTGLIMLASAALSACSRSSSENADTAALASTTSAEVGARRAGVAASSTPNRSACPRTGMWALCSVETRLVQSGFVVRRATSEGSRRAGFTVTPVVYMLGRSRLEVFIYPSESALAADVAKIDTITAAPRGAPTQWGLGITPTFVRSANLAAVFLTDNPTRAERLTLALTAGAPQP